MRIENRSILKITSLRLFSRYAWCLLILGILVQTIMAQATEQRFDYSVKVANADSVFQEIIRMASEQGGYFTNLSDANLSLRVPVFTVHEFEKTLKKLVEIEDKTFSSIDRSVELERLNSQIKSRAKLLESYMGMVKSAPFAELQSVEREMVSLNRQIEILQGQHQAMEKRTSLALISIQTNSARPLPKRPSAKYASPFKWINSTNLNSLREDF
jgi:hypothetical protein